VSWSSSFGTPFELPGSVTLTDDVIELKPIRMLGPGDAAARPSGLEFLAAATEYRFAIHRRSDAQRVGRIHVRNTADPGITRALGHLGYEVDEAHRRQGYAVRALRLLLGVAQHFEIAPLWVLIEPDNAASCRVVERCEFELVEELPTAPVGIAQGLGPRVRHYRRLIP
jgi:RimJ/RimL family protein N-acetyltransferase